MNHVFEGAEAKRIMEARESFSGRLLTNDQFDEAIAITGIVEKQIHKTGTFKDKLGDYANAFARSEKFSMLQGETIVRDLFKIRTGKTMNQLREGLVAQEEKLFGSRSAQNGKTNTQDKKIDPAFSERSKNSAYHAAVAIGELVEQGDKISFFRAYTHQAAQLAQKLGITEMGARRCMREEFQATEQRDLITWGKELEETYYKPQIEAEKIARKDSQAKQHSTNSKTPEQTQGLHTMDQSQGTFDRSR